MDDQRKREQVQSPRPTEQAETTRTVTEKASQKWVVVEDSLEPTRIRARTEVPPPEEAPPRDRSRDQAGG